MITFWWSTILLNNQLINQKYKKCKQHDCLLNVVIYIFYYRCLTCKTNLKVIFICFTLLLFCPLKKDRDDKYHFDDLLNKKMI